MGLWVNGSISPLYFHCEIYITWRLPDFSFNHLKKSHVSDIPVAEKPLPLFISSTVLIFQGIMVG